MSKKKKKQKRPQAKTPYQVRLSQCMIVKNEEKHIRRALEWAKPVAYEQIVIDTGSTDKTVEIAEASGAKVLHFKWIDDFSAAKNFALEQASGNWIAFLDADEYMSAEDANKMMEKLNKLGQFTGPEKSVCILRTPMLNVDDKGTATDVYLHSRIYRNVKEIRYHGRIHEHISEYGKMEVADDISIIHTGYAESEHKEKNKTERNITLLRKELENDPDSILIKAYLADSLRSKYILENYSNKKDEEEVATLFKEVIENNEKIPDFLKKKAYMYHIGKIWGNPDETEQCEKLCKAGHEQFPDDLDIGYYYSFMLNSSGKYETAWEILKKLESKLTTGKGHITGTSAWVQSEPKLIFGQLLMAAQGLKDTENTINYATVLLSADKSQQEILTPYIHTLISNGISESEVYNLLSQMYDTKSPSDLLFIARAAKECGAIEFTRFIVSEAEKLMG